MKLNEIMSMYNFNDYSFFTTSIIQNTLLLLNVYFDHLDTFSFQRSNHFNKEKQFPFQSLVFFLSILYKIVATLIPSNCPHHKNEN